MKQIISLLLIIAMSLSLCACNSGIELTLDNIEDYVELDAYITPGKSTLCKSSKGEYIYLYHSLKCNVSLYGNADYEYKDVTIGVKLTHNAPMGDFSSSQIVYVDLNLAGNGEEYIYLATPVSQEEWDNISTVSYTFYSEKNIDYTLDYASYEIVSVTGTVIKK